MAQSVLGSPKQGQCVAQIETHGFASARNGGVQGAARICGDGANLGGDEVGRSTVVLLIATIVHGLTVGVAHNVDVAAVKLDARQMIVAAKFVKPSQIVTE